MKNYGLYQVTDLLATALQKMGDVCNYRCNIHMIYTAISPLGHSSKFIHETCTHVDTINV